MEVENVLESAESAPAESQAVETSGQPAGDQDTSSQEAGTTTSETKDQHLSTSEEVSSPPVVETPTVSEAFLRLAKKEKELHDRHNKLREATAQVAPFMELAGRVSPTKLQALQRAAESDDPEAALAAVGYDYDSLTLKKLGMQQESNEIRGLSDVKAEVAHLKAELQAAAELGRQRNEAEYNATLNQALTLEAFPAIYGAFPTGGALAVRQVMEAGRAAGQNFSPMEAAQKLEEYIEKNQLPKWEEAASKVRQRKGRAAAPASQAEPKTITNKLSQGGKRLVAKDLSDNERRELARKILRKEVSADQIDFSE